MMMSVLTTSTSNVKEHLQELKRKLTEKDAQIASLSVQVNNQAHENIYLTARNQRDDRQG